jgi:hypothetical protein
VGAPPGTGRRDFAGLLSRQRHGSLWQLRGKLKKDDVVVIIFHDHGSRYVGKIYNDDWMRERGFLEDELKISDLISRKKDRRFFGAHVRRFCSNGFQPDEIARHQPAAGAWMATK